LPHLNYYETQAPSFSLPFLYGDFLAEYQQLNEEKK
jgi:hypothetical protein